MLGVIDHAGDPQYVPNIDTDRTAVVLIPGEVVDGRFETPVEVDSDQLAFQVQNRTP